MKHKHMAVIGALAICGSLLVLAPASFAAKAMNDTDMDGTTAAGQPRIDIGNGQQTLMDNSLYTVILDTDAQTGITGDNLVNVAGENNIAVGENVANVDTTGDVLQDNEITQQRNAQLTAASISWSAVAENDSAREGGATAAVASEAGVATGDMTITTINASADHIKIGHGDQAEEDDSQYTVQISDTAQQDAVSFSTVNAAGRNNVAVMLNAVNRDYTAFAGSVITSSITQLNTITQGN